MDEISPSDLRKGQVRTPLPTSSMRRARENTASQIKIFPEWVRVSENDQKSKDQPTSKQTLLPFQAAFEEAVVKQVEFYFSDGNLPGDKFLQGHLREGGDGLVSLAVVSSFNKMKKLIRKVDGGEGGLARILGASPLLRVSECGLRVGRSAPLVDTPDEAGLLMRTVTMHCLASGASIASVRAMAERCGEVRAVRMPAIGGSSGLSGDELGPRTSGPFAEVEFAAAEAAFEACDVLTDTSNWRGGLRVKLANGLTVAAAKRVLAKGQKKKKDKKTNTDHAPAAAEASAVEVAASAGGEQQAGDVSGRQRGKISALKAVYGFVAPLKVAGGRKVTRDDALYFSRKAPVAVGDVVEYDIEFNAASGKPNAVNVEVVSGISEEAKCVPPGAVEVAPEVVPPRPERQKLQLKTQHRIAKGPDGTLGFASRCAVTSTAEEAAGE